ncbi:MAG: diguanylate cyclase [Alphaproteobacteria bacterium]|nr:diguanylate cyclase [Alphaproteobacteria bacterium]
MTADVFDGEREDNPLRACEGVSEGDGKLCLPTDLLAYPGPLMVMLPSGRAAMANPAGQALLDWLDASPVLRDLSSEIADRRLIEARDAAGAARWFDVCLVPWTVSGAPGATLVLAREVTLDVNLRNALADSRQRFKELVEVGADFAWETDASGCFTFLSVDHVLGFPVEMLIGRSVLDLLDPVGSESTPFITDTDRVKVDTWVHAADGTQRCLVVSAVPILSADGLPAGARGVAWDVTDDRLREQQLARARLRDHVSGFIIQIIRDEAKPEEMLRSAVTAISRAVRATSCAILRVRRTGALVPVAEIGPTPPTHHHDRLLERLHGGERWCEAADEDWHGVTCATSYRGQMNGAVVIWRGPDQAPFDDEDRHIIELIEPHLGVALRQIQDQRRLERLSRTDPLTGLSNRRAFETDLAAALDQSMRHHRPGALLFFDLNNFKPVNDMLGHDAGDAVLKEFASLLRQHTRTYDLVARLGGDEFAMWLGEITAEDAQRRAEVMEAAAVPLLANFVTDPARPLGVSIGAAYYDGEDEVSAEDLLSRGDIAMYEVKRATKARMGGEVR